MSLTTGLAPLLDTSFLLALARHLRNARDRLALRTAGNLPTVTELVVALRLYISRRDRARLTPGPSTASPHQHTRSPTDAPHPAPRPPPPTTHLVYYLAVADAAYALNRPDLERRLANVNIPPPLDARHQADKWQPGYFIAHDPRHSRVVVAVRGSKELSDLITNLSADTEPFLSGTGHQGVVKSAHNLHELVRPQLAEIVDRTKPPRGIVVVGHSLGGAVASALTMLLRTPSLDIEFDENNESAYAKEVFRNTVCFAFAPPPFLSDGLAVRSREMDITTLVAGFDIVPRLSAASLDRLLVAVSRYNWGRDVSDSFGRAVGQVASGIMRPDDARSVSEAVMEHGATGISLASSAIAHTARAALDNPASSAERSPLWSLALNATAFVSSMVSESLAGSERRALVDGRRQPDYAFARHFGMSADDVERVLIDDAPQEMFLAGTVYHLDRAFSEPTEENDLSSLPPSTLVERDSNFFRDIEPSSWMVHDHAPLFMISALGSALR